MRLKYLTSWIAVFILVDTYCYGQVSQTRSDSVLSLFRDGEHPWLRIVGKYREGHHGDVGLVGSASQFYARSLPVESGDTVFFSQRKIMIAAGYRFSIPVSHRFGYTIGSGFSVPLLIESTDQASFTLFYLPGVSLGLSYYYSPGLELSTHSSFQLARLEGLKLRNDQGVNVLNRSITLWRYTFGAEVGVFVDTFHAVRIGLSRSIGIYASKSDGVEIDFEELSVVVGYSYHVL